MATVVETTIGGTTPDHDVVNTWEAATDNDLTPGSAGSDEIQRGLLQVLESNSTLLTWGGATTAVGNYRELTFGGTGGARYDPAADTGSGITSTGTLTLLMQTEDFPRLTGILIANTVSGGDTFFANTDADGPTTDGCTIKCDVSGDCAKGNQSTWRNCLFMSASSQTTVAFSNAGIVLQNCVIWSTSASARGFHLTVDDSSVTEVSNCTAFGHFATFFYDFDGTTSNGTYRNNISGDATAPGGSTSFQSETDTDVHTDPDNDDFTLVASGVAVEGGFDLSGDFTTDIEGTTRATPWDIGIYEFTAAGGTAVKDPIGMGIIPFAR